MVVQQDQPIEKVSGRSSACFLDTQSQMAPRSSVERRLKMPISSTFSVFSFLRNHGLSWLDWRRTAAATAAELALRAFSWHDPDSIANQLRFRVADGGSGQVGDALMVAWAIWAGVQC
jgi:hypothetical protein